MAKNSGPKRKLTMRKAIIYKNLTKMRKISGKNLAFIVRCT